MYVILNPSFSDLIKTIIFLLLDNSPSVRTLLILNNHALLFRLSFLQNNVLIWKGWQG